MQRNTHSSRRRGQTAVIAIVLLVGVVAVGSIGILLLGASATEQSKQNSEQQRVEKSFQQLDRDIDTVATGDDPAREIDLNLPDDSDAAVREDATGRIWVNRTNFTTSTTDVIVNNSIGSVRYTSERGDTIAYQAGGLWKESGNQTVMMSPPHFSYNFNESGEEPTLTLPIVVTEGPERLSGGRIAIKRNTTIAPTNDVTVVENDLVTVTVQSRWYVGWAEFFREIAADDQGVTVNHTRNTATLELIVPARRATVAGGIVTGAGGQDVEFDNNINIDNYNSSQGDYLSSVSSETKLIIGGTLEMNNNVNVEGDVTAGDNIEFNHPGATIDGNASYGNDLIDSSGSTVPPGTSTPHVTGWHNDNATLKEYESVDGVIDARTAAIQDENNNSANPEIDDTTDTFVDCSAQPDGDCDLHPGSYYLNTIAFTSGDTIQVHGSGIVNIVVDGPMIMDMSAGGLAIDIVGDARLNIYVNSETTPSPPGWDLFLKQVKVDIPDDKSPQLWIYTDKNAEAKLKGGSTEFTGVVFGPGDGDSNTLDGTDIEVDNQVQIFGALVGDVNNVGQNSEIHYDRALLNAKTLTANAKIPKLTFLHASLHRVCVSSTSNQTAC